MRQLLASQIVSCTLRSAQPISIVTAMTTESEWAVEEEGQR